MQEGPGEEEVPRPHPQGPGSPRTGTGCRGKLGQTYQGTPPCPSFPAPRVRQGTGEEGAFTRRGSLVSAARLFLRAPWAQHAHRLAPPPTPWGYSHCGLPLYRTPPPQLSQDTPAAASRQLGCHLPPRPSLASSLPWALSRGGYPSPPQRPLSNAQATLCRPQPPSHQRLMEPLPTAPLSRRSGDELCSPHWTSQ